MPYVIQQVRQKYENTVLPTPECAGELNYLFTCLINSYLREEGEAYQHYNDAIGALEACKLELYRRKVGLYEDTKIKQNGDVY